MSFDDKMSEPIVAYCVNCRAKHEMTNVEFVKMKNGRDAAKGICSKCDTGVFKILAERKVQ